MSNGSKNYKIYFPIYNSENWLGGVNYYYNLFRSISLLNNPNIKIYIPENNPDCLFEFDNIKKFNKKNFKYRIVQLFTRIRFKKFDKNKYFKKLAHKTFKLASHSNDMDFEYTIAWIQDFQHKYLREMFDEKEIEIRDNAFGMFAEKSSLVLLSSKNALNDFKKFYPDFEEKGRVLNFVSYINPNIYQMTEKLSDKIKNKYDLPQKYFYVPNQFWKHKNHITLFKAIKILKDQGIDINIVCSGNTHDYRSPDYFEYLTNYLKENDIDKNVKILGIIDKNDVYYLMRNCVSIINPSLFEGWSSTVEEAKSLGKNIILSDLDVHKEQNPPSGKFFERNNPEQLAQIMKENWETMDSSPDYELEENASRNLESRMIKFAQEYLNIVDELNIH